MKSWQVALPPLDEQQAISLAIQACGARLRADRASLGFLRNLKSALMSVLLTGEVRVRVDEEAAT